MNISLELFMARTTKGTQQKRRSKGDGSLFPNKRGGWTARYRKKGLPDKEFNAPTKGEAKALLDDWKIKVAIQDAITSNIKVQDYANKYLFRKSLMVEAGKFKQTSLDRLEKLGQSSIVPFLGRRGIKITHTLSRVKNREAGSKKKTKMILTPPKYPNSLRTIPLNKEAEFSLSCMMELYDKNRVFPDLILSTQNGVSPTIQNLANTLKKICKRAEIPEYNLHALRHTFATNLIRQTHNMGEIKEAAEIIGDNYEVIMRTYVHTDSERKVSLIDAMIA